MASYIQNPVMLEIDVPAGSHAAGTPVVATIPRDARIINAFSVSDAAVNGTLQIQTKLGAAAYADVISALDVSAGVGGYAQLATDQVIDLTQAEVSAADLIKVIASGATVACKAYITLYCPAQAL
jgi:hypothetical protein